MSNLRLNIGEVDAAARKGLKAIYNNLPERENCRTVAAMKFVINRMHDQLENLPIASSDGGGFAGEVTELVYNILDDI